MEGTKRQLFRNQSEIIHLISSGERLHKILEYITYSIENQFKSLKIFSSIMLYNSQKNVLEKPISYSLPANFIKEIGNIEIGPKNGSCGSAAFYKKPILVSNINVDPLWEFYRNVAMKYGFVSSWSIPILSPNNELLGTFAIYSKVAIKSERELLATLDEYNRLASIAIELSDISKRNDIIDYYDDKYLKKPTNDNDLKYYQLQMQLKEALLKDEFVLYYQPIVEQNSNILGLEALIRWNHPTKGLLLPASFLYAAEVSGLILEIEKWVLTHALGEIKKLMNSGYFDLFVAINISAQQLENQHFLSLIEDLFDQYDFPPDKLKLEITERFIIKKENIDTLMALKKIGVKISIDDFGTSYSSLHYLKDLPIDELKIDKSFISSIETNVTNQKIVEMIVMLGQQLNLEVVAEGVENASQLELLKNMNCKCYQGYLFSRPEPISKLFHSNILLGDIYETN